MVTVTVEIDGEEHSAEISQETYEILRDGSILRNRPLQEYLRRIVQEYGELTETTLLKFIHEKWVI